jgi:hypothetical protein
MAVLSQRVGCDQAPYDGGRVVQLTAGLQQARELLERRHVLGPHLLARAIGPGLVAVFGQQALAVEIDCAPVLLGISAPVGRGDRMPKCLNVEPEPIRRQPDEIGVRPEDLSTVSALESPAGVVQRLAQICAGCRSVELRPQHVPELLTMHPVTRSKR